MRTNYSNILHLSPQPIEKLELTAVRSSNRPEPADIVPDHVRAANKVGYNVEENDRETNLSLGRGFMPTGEVPLPVAFQLGHP